DWPYQSIIVTGTLIRLFNNKQAGPGSNLAVMDQSTSKRFQPYARPAPRRQQPEPIFNEDTFQNIPQVIIGLVKKSLSWLGIAQEQVFEPAGRTTAIRDSDRHGEASTSGSGTTNKETTPSTALERLYPDLRDFIVSLKSSKDDRGQNRNLKRSEHEMDTTSDVIEPEHSEHHRAKVRRELSESLDKYGDSKTPQTMWVTEPYRTDENSCLLDGTAIDGLDKEDLVWLPRIRRLTETPLERVREDIEPVPQPVSKPLDSVLPYNKDYRKHRQSALSRDTFNEHVMNSGDSGSDADESEHATKGTRDRSRTLTNIRQNRPREKQSENLQGSPGKNRRTSRTDALEDQRTSRGGLQIRSQVATKRTVRHIPGRFSALDSDEEEESLRQEEAAREQRRLHRSSIAGVWDTLSNIVNMDSQQTQPQLQGSISNKVPPQIYPTLQYGQRTKLYNPKLDEILKWSSSSHESTPAPDTNPSTKQKIGFTSPVLSEVVSAAPTVIGTLAAVAGAVGVAKLATDWSGIKLPDNTNKWKCQTCDGMNQNELEKCPSCEAAKPGAKVAPSTTPGVPALFTPSFTARSSLPSTPATNSAEKLDKNKGDEPRKQEDVATNTGREKNQESEKSVPSLGWAAAGFKVPDNSNKWKCPTCDVMNENEKIKCVCCETGKPGAKPAEQKSVALPSLFTPSFSAATPSTSGTSTQAIFSFAAPTTSSTGSTTIDNTSKSPKASALFGFNSPTSDKPSENAIDKPVEKPGPALTWAAAGFKVPDNTNKWKCPTCDVMNENKLEKCACCETSRPGGTTKDASAPPVPALFAFKPPISSSTSISTPGFITSTLPTSEAKVPALFGAQEAEKKQQPTFSFVVPATTAADTKAIPISFGNPFSQKSPTGLNATSEETKPTQPSFTFGSVSTPTSTSTPSSATSLFSSTAATPATSLFGSKTLTSTSASTSASVSAPTSTPLFGTTLATPPSTSIFGGTPLFSGSTTTSTTGASTPSSTTSLFSLSTLTSSASAPASTVPAAPGPQPLFGASSSAPPATVASNSASKFGSVTSLPFTFGSSSPNITLGQTTAPTASTVAPSTPPTSTSTFSFGSSLTSSTPATPGSGTGSGFGLGPSGFGALSSATAAPFSTTSAPTAAPLTGFSFGGASTATSQPTTKPTFSFGSSTPNSTNTSIPAFTFGGGGNNSNTSTSASSTSSGFGSFDSTSTPANNSMMSVKTPSSVGAIGTTGSGGTGFGFGSNAQSTGMSFGAASSNVSFGGGSSAPTSGFGTLAPGSNGFGASLSTQSGGFGSTSTGTPSNPFGQNSSSFGGQTAGFGSPIGSTTSAGVGFGASSAGFNGSGSSGFGGSNSGGSGFISLAGSGGSTPGFGGASSTGFGGGGGGMQQQQQQQQQGTAMFGGFGVGGGNDGKFGFQNISNAPGGSQYPQQTGVQQPAFSFNVGAGPAPGETPPHNRKFAKMRTKKR
ncbi:hypothetical protein BGX34_001420, partial [Mortierella sp. NVP85]